MKTKYSKRVRDFLILLLSVWVIVLLIERRELPAAPKKIVVFSSPLHQSMLSLIPSHDIFKPLRLRSGTGKVNLELTRDEIYNLYSIILIDGSAIKGGIADSQMRSFSINPTYDVPKMEGFIEVISEEFGEDPKGKRIVVGFNKEGEPVMPIWGGVFPDNAKRNFLNWYNKVLERGNIQK